MEIILLPVTLVILVAIGYFSYLQMNRSDSEKKLRLESEIAEFSKAFVSIGEEYLSTGLPEIDSDIKLKPTEKLYVVLNDIQWYEYRKVSTGNFTAHGFTGRVKIAKGLSYRFGTGQIVRETLDLLKPLDRGDLYVTNLGMFFRGAYGNKNIPFNKIIMINPATNHIKIERDSGKDVYIKYDFSYRPKQLSAIVVAWDKIEAKKMLK